MYDIEYLLTKIPRNYKLITGITEPIDENTIYCFSFIRSRLFTKGDRLIIKGIIEEINMEIQLMHHKKLKYLFSREKKLILMGKIQGKSCFFPQVIQKPKDTIEVTYAVKTDIAKVKTIINKFPTNSSLYTIFNNIFFPSNLQDTQEAFDYLATVEIFIFRKLLQDRECDIEPMLAQASKMSFTLTDEQEIVNQEINQDLESSRTRVRLVQGEVGSGKTMLMLMAASKVVNSGKKVIIMAPTSLLAEQLYEKFLHYTDHKIGIVSSTSNTFRQDREILIGTHALLFLKEIDNIGLVIIDEQHKFGVLQRNQLCANAHLLMLTATPIPRTTKMTMENLIHFSIMKKSSTNRTNTYIVNGENKNVIIDKVIRLAAHTRVIWVCKLINEAEVVFNYFQSLVKTYLIHGSIKNKSEILDEFKNNECGLLVATTVIEVGIDIDVNFIVIENADQYGLAQIHQLRGRVGRRKKEGHCILLGENMEKLQSIKDASSGMEISQLDLVNRRGGVLYDKNQSGKEELKFIRDITNKPSLQHIINRSHYIEKPQQVLIDAMISLSNMMS